MHMCAYVYLHDVYMLYIYVFIYQAFTSCMHSYNCALNLHANSVNVCHAQQILSVKQKPPQCALGYQPPLQNTTSLFFAKPPPLNPQTAQAPPFLFRQSPLYTGFS